MDRYQCCSSPLFDYALVAIKKEQRKLTSMARGIARIDFLIT